MRRQCIHLLLLLTGLLSLTVAAEQVPDMKLEHLDGDKRPVTDYVGQGKWAIINVWSPSCSACVAELPTIRKFRKLHPEVDVIGVTIDFPSFGYGKRDVTLNFLENSPLDYPIFLADMDLASEVIGNRLVAIPLIAIVHPGGEVLARWPGKISIAEIEDYMKNYEDYNSEGALTEGFE